MAFADAMAVFSGIFVLTFGLTVFLSGLFSSYFGAGKSRKIGLALVIVGLMVLFAWVTITYGIEVFITFTAWTTTQMAEGVAAVLGGLIGALVGLALFLIAIMRA